MKIKKNQLYFKCMIISPRGILFDEDIYSLFVKGDKSEYELLAYHYPVIGVIKNGYVIINQERRIRIMTGVIQIFANECIILYQEEIK